MKLRTVRQAVGRVGPDVALAAQHVRRALERLEDDAADDVADGVQAELEREDDTEVAAAAAQRPEAARGARRRSR